jgi:hypothetical protein
MGVVGCGDAEEPVWREPNPDFIVYIDKDDTPDERRTKVVAAARSALREFCQQHPSESVWISSPISVAIACSEVLDSGEPERATAAMKMARSFRAGTENDLEWFANESEWVAGGGNVGFSPVGFTCSVAVGAAALVTYETDYCERVWNAHRKGAYPGGHQESV